MLARKRYKPYKTKEWDFPLFRITTIRNKYDYTSFQPKKQIQGTDRIPVP